MGFAIAVMVVFLMLGTKDGREACINWIAWLILIYACITFLAWLITNKII